MNPGDAKRLVSDPALKEALSLMRDRYRKEFENTPSCNTKALKLTRIKFDLIREFFAELNKVLNDELMKE